MGGFAPKEIVEQATKGEIKLGDASYFAPFIAYLASDAAAHINGVMFYAKAGSIGIWDDPRVVRSISKDWEKEGRWYFDEIEKRLPEILGVK